VPLDDIATAKAGIMAHSMTDESAPHGVRLVVADVDGTLLTPEKVLTPRARAAARAIMEAGISFTITSSRPLRGLTMWIEELRLRDPIAAFNGGVLARPDLSVIRERVMSSAAAHSVIDILTEAALDVWIYTDSDWRVRSRHGPHVDHEERTVHFAPTVVSSFEGALDRVVKIVGVSDDAVVMERAVRAVQETCSEHVSASRSEPYYVDVTHPQANKGEAVSALSSLLNVPLAQIATIGDMPTDMLMFSRSGVSIAMGNASAVVQHAARFVTKSNTEEGFAIAMERFVLGAPDRLLGRAQS
jgi:Cof subfamily protein (haloacid dehalogenase superfamily)